MADRDVLAIGASAGGVEALRFLARNFRPDFRASVLITIHLRRDTRSTIDDILSRAGPQPASFAHDGEPMRQGQIYLAPPGYHLLAENDRLVLGSGPQENNSLPAIDPMLRALARCCGGRAVGIVLTGALNDGASGLWTLGQSGGHHRRPGPSRCGIFRHAACCDQSGETRSCGAAGGYARATRQADAPIAGSHAATL